MTKCFSENMTVNKKFITLNYNGQLFEVQNSVFSVRGIRVFHIRGCARCGDLPVSNVLGWQFQQ